jgi:hypothetical protein
MTIRRRQFIALLGGAVWPFAVSGQQRERARRVGMLMAGSPPNLFVAVLQNSLRELDYIEGRNKQTWSAF